MLYQLRHGGPSHDRRSRTRSLAEVKQRGRWASDTSVRRYEAHARLQQEEASLTVAQRRRAIKAAGAMDSLIKSAGTMLGHRLASPRATESSSSSSSTRPVAMGSRGKNSGVVARGLHAAALETSRSLLKRSAGENLEQSPDGCRRLNNYGKTPVLLAKLPRLSVSGGRTS